MNIFISWPTYRLLSYIWIALAVLVFFVLLFVAAPYGRHTTNKWGPAINNRIGWMIMEMPVLLVLIMIIFPYRRFIDNATLIILGLFCFHYFNRVFLYPLRLHTRGKTIPLLIVASAVLFNLVNGSLIGYYFTHFASYKSIWFSDFRFMGGILLFFVGMFINWKADDMLINLRRPKDTHYVIPRTWLFEYISCPNYFGELIEWLGFAILCWNLPGLCFFIWTAANLIPRAIAHHKWYKERFKGYPKNRKAVIPFVV